jgi:hypothetical protein
MRNYLSHPFWSSLSVLGWSTLFVLFSFGSLWIAGEAFHGEGFSRIFAIPFWVMGFAAAVAAGTLQVGFFWRFAYDLLDAAVEGFREGFRDE